MLPWKSRGIDFRKKIKEHCYSYHEPALMVNVLKMETNVYR
jgi:hypothetical protein